MSRSKLADFEILSRLGAGSFGVVYKVRRIVDNQFYVIKNVRIAELSYKEQTEAINEVQILAQLKSPYVVRYFDSFIDKDSLHIVMEFCNRGDLQNLLKKAKEKNVPGLKDNVIWNICLQVILGLYYLHKKHILHRDLKTANVFLLKDPSQENYLVKIGDLGVAKLMDTSTALANTIVGTPYYLSPELCKDMPYRDKSDCWALGVIVYECLTLQRPFDAKNQCALILKIIEAEPLPPPSLSMISNSLWNLSIWLLQKDPNKRPSVKDLLTESVIRDRVDGLRFSLPEELFNSDITHFLTEEEDSNKISNQERPSSAASFRSHQTQPREEYSQEKPLPASSSTSNTPRIEDRHTAVPANSGNVMMSPALTKPPSMKAVTKAPSQRISNEAKQKVRGDRVRGNNRRMPSEKALNRYQMKPPPTKSTLDYNADRKASDQRLVALSSSKELGYLDSPGNKTSQEDEEDLNEDIAEDVEEYNEDDYEPDFEEDDRLDAKSVHLTDEEVRDSEENLISPIDDVAQPYNYERVVDTDSGNMHRANSIVTNHGEHDVESWKELILEGKRKAFYDLGEDLYRKVYDLCDFHMKENVDEGEGNIKLVTELEALIRREQYTNFELACEAAFRIKMLLVLESRYGKLDDDDEKTLRK